MDSPAWKKWPFHLQSVPGLWGRLAGTAAIQGQLLPFLKSEYSPQRELYSVENIHTSEAEA